MFTQVGDIEPGLHLHCPDGRVISLTVDGIDARSRALLNDPARTPAAVKEAADFQLCPICPKRDTGEPCHAMRPILAVSGDFDAYPSTTPVTAIYMSGAGQPTQPLIAAQTTLQRALQYVSVLSLMYYCEVGREYWRYFYGVHPLLPIEDVVARVYLNMLWACGGDRDRTRALAGRFHDEITVTTQCQMRRLRLVCRSDALLNALVLTQIAGEFIVDQVDALVGRRIEEFGRHFFR